MNDSLSDEETARLIRLLEKRLSVIGDAELREQDAEAHLEQLKEVSEAIVTAQRELSEKFSPRLRHFFEGCSYEKALAFLKSTTDG